MATNDTKRKKGSHKTVYFNVNDPAEYQLYEYASKIKNFSGFIKRLVYQEMAKRNGALPNPFEFGFGELPPMQQQAESTQLPHYAQPTAPVEEPVKVPVQVKSDKVSIDLREKEAVKQQEAANKEVSATQEVETVVKEEDRIEETPAVNNEGESQDNSQEENSQVGQVKEASQKSTRSAKVGNILGGRRR
ncbi:hypothetical protein ACFX4N_23940 [Priestia sp. YIM B13551]|uniref:hypothetical protein n=1 Tax=Priestia sp. YIM B13551 TaxID=3366306 RepID=UPI0036717309